MSHDFNDIYCILCPIKIHPIHFTCLLGHPKSLLSSLTLIFLNLFVAFSTLIQTSIYSFPIWFGPTEKEPFAALYSENVDGLEQYNF